MVKQMLIISILFTLAAGFKEDNENLLDFTREIVDCDKTCYMASYDKGYTLGYARYKCCLDKNSKLGIPVTMQHEENSQKLVVSIRMHFSCDMECYNSYFALGYSPVFADQECCYSSSSALNKNSRGSSLHIQLIDASASSDLNTHSISARSSDLSSIYLPDLLNDPWTTIPLFVVSLVVSLLVICLCNSSVNRR